MSPEKAVQERNQTACKREDMAESGESSFQRSLGGQSWVQGQRVPGKRLQLHLRKTFLTELLNH